MEIDRVKEAERYINEGRAQGGEDNTSYQSVALVDDLISGRTDWEKRLQWANSRPDGFIVEAGGATIYLYLGRMREANQVWERAAKKAEQQHIPDSAGGLYALKAVHDALVSDCAAARDAAHKGLALDHSLATVPDAALAMALCGEAGPALKEVERVAAESPNNTVYSEIVVPEVKAAAALAQHNPEQVAGLLAPVVPYQLVSKAPHLLGRASLEMKKPRQAVSDFEPGIRYKALALGEGGNGLLQAPDYVLCLLGTARAQAQFDKAAAAKSYSQLLDIWKNADADFIPAQEARRELAGLATAEN
jgi:hypothetical protein